MPEVEKQIKALQESPGQILSLLKDGPMMTGDLIEGLGYSVVNLVLSLGIGDGKSHWEQGTHILALSDLIEQGQVRYWQDEDENCWYSLPETRKENQ